MVLLLMSISQCFLKVEVAPSIGNNQRIWNFIYIYIYICMYVCIWISLSQIWKKVFFLHSNLMRRKKEERERKIGRQCRQWRPWRQWVDISVLPCFTNYFSLIFFIKHSNMLSLFFPKSDLQPKKNVKMWLVVTNESRQKSQISYHLFHKGFVNCGYLL